MDNDYELNVEEILQTIGSAEIIAFRFVVISQHLVIDTRSNAVDGPMIRVVPHVKSTEEGFQRLKQLRPRFRIPEKICAIWWPKHIDSLVTHRIWPAVVQRLIDTGRPGIAKQCEKVLRELLQREKEEVQSAILGKGYQALWECQSQDQPKRG
jgi:hypothetical protein